jgi:hypothetical protein
MFKVLQDQKLIIDQLKNIANEKDNTIKKLSDKVDIFPELEEQLR